MIKTGAEQKRGEAMISSSFLSSATGSEPGLRMCEFGLVRYIRFFFPFSLFPGFNTLTSHFTKWQSMIMLQLTHFALMPFCRNAVFWNSIVHVCLYLLFFCGNGFLFLVDAAFTVLLFSAQFSIWWHGVVQGSLQAKYCFSYTLLLFFFRKCEIFHWNLFFLFDTFLDVCFLVMKWCEKQNEHWFLLLLEF